MAKYRVETDNGNYEVETEDNGGFQLLSQDGGPINQGHGNQAAADYWKQKGDLPEAGAEKPVEQRLAENAVTAGNGVMLPEGIAGAAGLAQKALGAGGEGASTLAQYAGRFGENQMGKLHGTSALQFKQLGREGFGPSMRASYDLGDANLGLGSIGREQAVNERVAQIGSDLGDIRGQATDSGAQMSPQEMTQAIQEKLGPDYAPGGKHFVQQGSFNANLENIGAMPEGGASNFAQRASEINSNAAGSKLVLPAKSAAETDIAGQMSHINDANIEKNLPEDVADQYGALKEQFGYAKNLQPMELRGQAKEALGPAPSTLVGIGKSVLNATIGGPKVGAQMGFGAESALTGTSKIMNMLSTNPASLGRYAAPLQQAYQTGGSTAVAAMHYVMSSQYPDYNAMTQEQP